MKLCRIGNIGNEKPALIDNENNYRDLSGIIKDFDPSTLNFNTLKKISETNIQSLSIISKDSRVGAIGIQSLIFLG